MNLVKWEPFKEMERFFAEDFFPFLPTTQKIGFDLAVDVYEEKGNVIVEMNLHGIDPEKVEITVHNEYVKVFGKREEEKETKEKDFYTKEIRRGTFERLVKLPAKVKTVKAEAKYKNGTLKIVLPKLELEKEEKIKVQVQ
jgi:HSP20 family protein